MWERFCQPLRYALAVMVLGSSAAWIQWAQLRGELTILKKPLPIRRLLKNMDRDALAPYEVLNTPSLSADVVQELGTEEYINWILRDPRHKKGRKGKVTLSVTYYTDVHDQVPHVPEECYLEGAYQLVDDEKLSMRMHVLGREVPVRRQTYHPPREHSKMTVLYYTICVNGDFYCDRQRVRWRMGDSDETHLYYSKVEVAYQNVTERDMIHMDERAGDLLDRVLVELERSHWPARGSGKNGPATKQGDSTDGVEKAKEAA